MTLNLFVIVPPFESLLVRQGSHRDDSPAAQSRFDRRESRANYLGVFYTGKHRAEYVR